MANILFHTNFLAKITVISVFKKKKAKKAPTVQIMGLHLQTENGRRAWHYKFGGVINKDMLINIARRFVNE